jgi:small subunit ribosomal protein S1
MTTEQQRPAESGLSQQPPEIQSGDSADLKPTIDDVEPTSVKADASVAQEAVAQSAVSESETADAGFVESAPSAESESVVAREPGPAEVADAVEQIPSDADEVTACDAAPVVQSESSPRGDAQSAEVSKRIRERMGAPVDVRPVGTSDEGVARPETPSSAGPVEIPRDDDLDESLEAQISAAMSTDISAPVDAAPVVGLDGEEGEAAPTDEIGPGSELQGTVQQIHGDDVFIEAGVRSAVIVALKQFPEDKKPSVGDQLKVIVDTVDSDGVLRARIPQARHKAGGNWDALAKGQVVDCMVTGTNKGGLQVAVSSLKGFIPASQVDLGYVADLETFVGQKLSAQITEVNKKKRNLVLSRRILLQAERASQQGEFWPSLEVGQDHEGIVKTIKDYGAFVSLGPMDGFLHIGEMSWSRINHPNEVLKFGQTIQVRILRLDEERQRISLGMKQLIQNPWQSAAERYAPERVVPGKVSRIADFGAFVELEPGMEGLVHISELAWRRVASVNEVLSLGETRDFQVMEVDVKRKRVSLSVKALEQRPDAPAPEERPSAAPRKPNPNLLGGTGGDQEGGGLFGNPSDFK